MDQIICSNEYVWDSKTNVGLSQIAFLTNFYCFEFFEFLSYMIDKLKSILFQKKNKVRFLYLYLS